MTTASEGAELTQVGPGTPMGRLMRHYWLPALLSSELEREARRPLMLGARSFGFRDSAGRVGVMDHLPARRDSCYSPQRAGRAALHLSRLEIRRLGNDSTCRK